MSMVRVVIGLTWLMLIVLWGAVWNQSATAPHPLPMRAHTVISLEVPQDRETYIEPRVDLYGNEVSDAIGDYRVDPFGELYERHSPDTAVLKLKPPEI